MKRVFHIITHFDMGGAERVAASIAKSPAADMEYHVLEIVRGRSAYTKVFIGELRQGDLINSIRIEHAAS